jgi:UPF0716 protein FxsA
LLLLFVIVPILELWVIGRVEGVLGWPLTLALLFGDGLIGAWLVRREGRRAWDALRRALSEVRWPGDEVAQGALVVFGGALLLTPGFLTDVVGLLAVLPPSRALIARQLRARLRPLDVGGLGTRPSGRRGGRAGDVLDVEVLSIEPDEPDSSAGGEPTNT